MNARLRPRTTERAQLCNALRSLAIDAIESANSSHPAMPTDRAEVAEALWRGHLKRAAALAIGGRRA